LNVGGGFTTVGDGSRITGYFGIYDNALATGNQAAASVPALALYPNPAHATATLSLPATATSRSVQVLDALGRTLRRQMLPAHAATAVLDLRGLPAGVYVVRCGAATTPLVVE
jgi:hypothetical protein